MSRVISEDTKTILGAMRTAAWEEAKGKLRALAALQGAEPGGGPNEVRWMQAAGKIERFIAAFEAYGLHE